MILAEIDAMLQEEALKNPNRIKWQKYNIVYPRASDVSIKELKKKKAVGVISLPEANVRLYY